MAMKAGDDVSAVHRVAAVSRLLVLALAILFRSIFRPYDTSASLNPPCLSAAGSRTLTPAWTRAAAAVESTVVWDGVHFLRVAECGYEYEQRFAFLPLFPFFAAAVARTVLAPLEYFLGYRAVLAVAGYVLNNVAFVLAAGYLYRLSLIVLTDRATALWASILFCFNPASVFYSSLYSESLYSLTSLGGLYYLFSGSNILAVILLALSGSARSNGALNAGYFCFQALLQIASAAFRKKPIFAVRAAGAAALQSLILFLPFIAFQTYGFINMCMRKHPDELRPWCKSKVPLLYGFVQSHYWGVGFLRYFQVKQLPNFFLASPALSLAVCSIIHYGQSLIRLCKTTQAYDLVNSVKWPSRNDGFANKMYVDQSLIHHGETTVRRRKPDVTNEHSSRNNAGSEVQPSQAKLKGTSILLLPFILHLVFLAFTAFFVMHVQVATRFFSASPPIYWFASHLLVSRSRCSRRWGYLISAYFIAYILLGCLLFSNFYPFT